LGANDNGNVAKITNNRDTTRSVNYGYDNLNRIANAYTVGKLWCETDQIDPWSNLNKITAYTGKPQPENLNQMAGPNNQFTGMSYDAAGNLLNDAASNYVFDGENRITTGAGVTYTYDGDGRRVKKSNGKLYWYGAGSDPLDETDLAGNTNNSTFNEYIFFGSRRVARRDSSGNVFYYVADHLGTSRSIVQSGQSSSCYDADFTPYGQEMQHTERLQTTACPPNYRFTGYEYDSETGLSYAFARYYSPRLGRFMSTDPLGGSVGNLQSHNAYAYVLNNPLAYVDPTGLTCYIPVTSEGDGSVTWQATNLNEGDCRKEGGTWIPDVNTTVTVTAGGGDDGGSPAGGCASYYQDGVYIGNTCGGDGNGNRGNTSGGGTKNNSSCVAPSAFPHSLAFVGGAEATGGVAAAGGSAQVTIAPLFVSSSGNVGSFMSTSTFANLGSKYAANVPQRDTPIAFGAYGGVGLGGVISNATNVSQLSGPFETYTLSIPAISVSFSFGGGIWELQGAAGPGWGVAHTYSTSNTVIRDNNQPCH